MLEKNSQNIALLQYCNGLLVHVHAMDINPVTHCTSFVRLVQVSDGDLVWKCENPSRNYKWYHWCLSIYQGPTSNF